MHWFFFCFSKLNKSIVCFARVIVILLVALLPTNVCVLPSYTPAVLQRNQQEMAIMLRQYVAQGYSNAEILGFLGVIHGVAIGMRTLKRWLKLLKLKRHRVQHEAPMEAIVTAIIKEMNEYVGSRVGYRDMTRRLRLRHNLVVTRDTVMHALRVIDPQGVENRRRHRLQRRRYCTPGPNFLWHLDGWDKLKPYGFCVHGCMDGFSRRILWLEVGSTNNDPKVVVNYFLSTVQQLKGVPRLIRTDKGTENTWIAVLQKFFRRNDEDGLAGNNSIIQGKSTANQRIEAFWSKLKQGAGGWWVHFFKDLRDSGIYRDHDQLHRECLKLCFMKVLRQELYSIASLWNTKRIEVKGTDLGVVGGKPDVMFFLPEVYTTRSYLIRTDERDVRICQELYSRQSRDYSEEIEDLAEIISPGYEIPIQTEEALRLFVTITTELDHLGF